MAYYSYYQNSQPYWGTSQYQFVDPPAPAYQPQPSWRGADYFRAHAGATDNTLFDYVWFKLRNMVLGAGIGRNEAAHWWRRVYSGMVDPSALLPREIGAAAGHEAIRCWERYTSVYAQPLSADREREREALIGLATAEAAKLWSYTGRPLDKYGRSEASEVAAATAWRIFAQSYDYNSPYESYSSVPRSRRRSISGVSNARHRSPFEDEYFDDDDDDMLDEPPYAGRVPRRGLSRRRSNSVYGRASSPMALEAPGMGARRYSRSPSPMPLGGVRGRRYSRSPSPVPYGGMGAGVGLSSSAISPYASAVDNSFGPGIPGTYYPPAYGASAGSSPNYAYPRPRTPGAYTGAGGTSGYGMVMGGGSPYMNSGYMGASVGLPPPPAPAGQYLATPTAMYPTTGHRRSRSVGAYGAASPSFRGY